nr:LysR family transcriptional regulator [Actinopolyspora biskrensis]
MQLLRAVINSGSVTVAATNLGYTPSAISQQLATLEREAGVPLLEKVGRGIRATQAGAMVAERAGAISKILSDTTAELAGFRDGYVGRVRIRWSDSIGASLVPHAVTAYRGRSPDVRIEPCLSDDSLREVMDAQADIALVSVPSEVPRPSGVRMIHLLDDPFRAVLPVDHPLAEQDAIDLAQLADEPWVENASGSTPDTCTELLRQACASAGFTPSVAIRADDFLTAQSFVAAGLGIRLAPELGLRVGAATNVVARPVRRPEPTVSTYLAVRDSVATQTVVTDMIDEIHTAAAELTHSVRPDATTASAGLR